MKIAISSQGNDLKSTVDPRFGRAQYFIIYDSETEKHDILDNSENVQAGQGAGIQTAQKVAAQNVEVVISGNLGPKAFQVLSAAKIKTALWADGSVEDAIKLVLDNKLTFTQSANVKGHWMS